MKRLPTILATALILTAACTEEHSGSNADHVIGITPENGIYYLSDTFTEYETIFLEDALVSNIKDVILTEDGLIIQARTDNDIAVSLFSRNGEFISPVVRIGRGPGELTNVDAMAYNPYTNTLDVLGEIGTKIIKYDCGSFEPVSTISLRDSEIISARDFCPIDEDRYIFYKDYSLLDEQEYFLYVHNCTTNETEGRFLPMDKQLAEVLSFGQTNNLYSKDGAIYFYAAFQNRIYEYSDGTLSPFIDFAENKFSFPDKLLKDHSYKNLSDFVNTCKTSPYIWAHINVFAYRNYIFSTYMYQDKVHDNIMNLETDSSDSYTELRDDLIWDIKTSQLRSIFYLVSTTDSNAIYTVEPLQLKELIEQQAHTGEDKAIKTNREKVLALPDDANPIILLLK